MRWSSLAVCALMSLHCGGKRSTSDERDERKPELHWDEHVGWELDRPFPPGKTSRKRGPTEYLALKYASLDNAQLASKVVLHGGLRDRSLIARPQELCHPNLQNIVASVRPDRLLIRIDGTPTPKQAACLAALRTPALYLGLCHTDRTSSFGRCDGDAQLRVLAAVPELTKRVRAIGVAFDDQSSWRLLPRFGALEYLAVRGKALTRVDEDALAQTCAQSALHSMDLFDATQLGNAPPVSTKCLYRLRHYAAAALPRHQPPPSTPCNLREVMTWTVDAHTRALFSGCKRVRLRGVREEAAKGR